MHSSWVANGFGRAQTSSTWAREGGKVSVIDVKTSTEDDRHRELGHGCVHSIRDGACTWQLQRDWEDLSHNSLYDNTREENTLIPMKATSFQRYSTQSGRSGCGQTTFFSYPRPQCIVQCSSEWKRTDNPRVIEWNVCDWTHHLKTWCYRSVAWWEWR